jgi:hypothetical protein
MNQWVAFGLLLGAIIALFALLYRGIRDIPDSGRSMTGPFYSPWFKRDVD